jgi:hypothetical protein
METSFIIFVSVYLIKIVNKTPKMTMETKITKCEYGMDMGQFVTETDKHNNGIIPWYLLDGKTQ